MRYFSIKELERLSGIKAHTIRAWEDRYNVFLPERTPTHIRYYTTYDLEHLLHLSLLLNKGYRISKLACISKGELAQKVRSLSEEEDRKARYINSLLVYMYNEDIDQFEYVLDGCVLAWGIDVTLRSIIIPFLKRADILSYSNSSPDVHFAVTAVRKKIIRGIEGLSAAPLPSVRALLFLAKDEHYDLVLLYMNYLLKAWGMQVFYLGTNISSESLETVLVSKKPGLVFTYAASSHPKEEIYADTIKRHLPEARLFIVHHTAHPLKSNCANVSFVNLNNIESLRNADASVATGDADMFLQAPCN